MKKNIAMLLAAVLAVCILAGCGRENTTAEKENKETQAADKADGSEEELLSGIHHVEIVVKDYGIMAVELDADTAPISVTNFVNLAKEGFYDGLTFHRVVEGFMIQGGAPSANGTGGSEKNIKGEFSQNGVENDIKHERGVISMARAQDMNSASSQFFIMQEAAPHLDGGYAAFGHVTEGIEIVDKICENVKPENEITGLVAADEQPVIEKITVID